MGHSGKTRLAVKEEGSAGRIGAGDCAAHCASRTNRLLKSRK